jgi:hypothetical protein
MGKAGIACFFTLYNGEEEGCVMPRNLIAAIAASTLLALMLSFVPGVTWKEEDVPTFQASRPIELSEQNVVDLFTLVPTHYNIKRVKWENQSVFVDFVVGPKEKVELPLVYRDFYTLTYDMFHFTDNVKQVFFRLLEEGTERNSSAKLLVAIEAKRSQTSLQTQSPEAIADIEGYVKAVFPVRIDPYFQQRVTP